MAEPDIDVRGSRVLVVDDTPANLEVLSLALEDAGYQVMFADAGAVALDLAARFEPALILLDVNMPGMDGFEGFRAGGVDYVVKPFHKEEVLARVRTQLERVQLLGEVVAKNAELEEKNRALKEEIGYDEVGRIQLRRQRPQQVGGGGQQTDPIPLVPQTLGHQLAGVVLDFNQVDVHG